MTNPTFHRAPLTRAWSTTRLHNHDPEDFSNFRDRVRGGIMVLERVRRKELGGSEGISRQSSDGAPAAPAPLSYDVVCRIRPSGGAGDSGSASARARRLEVVDASTAALDGTPLSFGRVMGPDANQVCIPPFKVDAGPSLPLVWAERDTFTVLKSTHGDGIPSLARARRLARRSPADLASCRGSPPCTRWSWATA